MDKRPATAQQAIENGRDVGRQAYPDVDNFDASAEEDRGHWKVTFKNPRALADGASAHFAVWIDKETGEVRLFRGR